MHAMKIRIASAQYPITAHAHFEAWEQHISTWVENALHEAPDLLLFPEYGSMELVRIFRAEIQEDIQLQVREMQSIYPQFCAVFEALAIKHQLILVAPSFPVEIGKSIVNRVSVFGKKGFIGYQDKFFMTRFENESWKIDSGAKKLTLFEAPWGKFGIQICYDIEFGIGSKLLCDAGATLILAPSCTETLRGATRVHVGARARALENQCYVAVSQTVGEALWSPAVDINFGYAACYATPDIGFSEEGIETVGIAQAEKWLFTELDFEKIREVRADGQVLNFRDQRNILVNLASDAIEVKRVYTE